MSELGPTAEQLEVAEAGPETRQLVTAGPGTGKTFTLVARIGHLVDFHDVHPAGILALSFSRAAVGELARRLRATGEDGGRVAPVTFDSFATRVLAEVDPDGAWTEQSYDGRIEAAIARVGDISELLSSIEHVCVDEMQDLVGVRMRFVRALLERIDAGFTLLGDPAQGIYDFSLAEDETAEEDGAPALYRWVREHFAGELAERPLTVNHRAKSDIAKRAAAIGPTVVSDHQRAMAELRDVLADAPRLSSLGMLRNAAPDQRTAILCRNNGHALWVSRNLKEAGVDHIVQRRAETRAVAPWVARLIASTGGGVVNRTRFEAVLGNLGVEVDDYDAMWLPLRRIARDELGVDLDKVVRRLREGYVPDELNAVRRAPITVSTVHRAKGLEFDRVVIIDDGWKQPPFDDDDARTLFVAESRTIEILTSAALPEIGGRLMLDDWTDRWVHGGWDRWKRLGIEVKAGDVETTHPAGSFVLKADAAATQQLLAADVQLGDPVELEFVRPIIGEPGAVYRIIWDGHPIGLATSRFGVDLMRVLKTWSKWRYPASIDGLTIDAVRSIGGDPMITNQEGLGPGGAWLAPSLVGIGRFNWKDTP